MMVAVQPNSSNGTSETMWEGDIYSEGKIRALFDAIDEDKSGTVDQHELLRAMDLG